MDCTFKTEKGKFNYRVGAIIIHDNKVLMVKSSSSPYYYSVGGRVHLHESMEEAIRREVYEETGISFEIDRMGYIHENFFILDPTGEEYHELSMYYYMKPIEDYSLINKSLTEDGIEESLEWIPLNDIENYNIYPSFFKDEKLLSNEGIIHVVDRE
ncbi:NUDIX domain-containing protein [Clostridium sp. D2Q-11]|uniref:NUDIX domain-containing protein n=1 Tax=Anaeromonas frigoriresistens TaxID=2683708 RepID=A0A942ZA95_9FIRM|nr:NUDIX domain-containing protein [Anaeromonas frigoriresistens]MBS4539585.1 NUDIX domain-containing protein [Anaeromonas frigoriresistens]